MAGGSGRSRVIESFTRKAAAVTGRPAYDPDTAVIRMARPAAGDTVLDIGCGPGRVACRFAARARHVTGIDITPAMIARARQLQEERGLRNVSWHEGDALHLPCADGSFSIMISRYAFHHIPRRRRAFREMVRVCAPGGRILLADVVISGRQRAAFNRTELLKDPSHYSVMRLQDYLHLAEENGLTGIRLFFFRLEMDLEDQLGATVRDPAMTARIRRLYRDDTGRNAMGTDARMVGGRIRFSYPTLIMAGRKKT